MIDAGLLKRGVHKQFRSFFRETLFHILKNEGWFDYLRSPRSLQEIAVKFAYSDLQFLERILHVLSDEKIVRNAHGSAYQGVRPDGGPAVIAPAIFTPALVDVWTNYGKAIPERLRGKPVGYTQGSALSNWNDALRSPFYNGMRRTACAFAGIPGRPVHFLDVGSGIGNGTAQIWALYFKKGHVPADGMRMVGVEPDPGFLQIAGEKFPHMAAYFTGEPVERIESQKKHFPTFVKGTATDLPFPDQTFDCVFSSHMMYLTNPEKSIAEMLRVTKPKGFVFGTQAFLSHPYTRIWTLFMQVIKGAHGYFSKKDMERWATQAGAASVEFATPISVFKITKRE